MNSENVAIIAVPSLDEAIGAIKLLFQPGQVVELRSIGIRGATVKKKFTLSGYYNDHQKLAENIIRATNTPGVDGVYWTIQKINPALLARSQNKYREGPKETTSDRDVQEYAWLPFDIDPVRATGISSTDEEKQSACEVLNSVVDFFGGLGCELLTADSGNGYHALLRVSLPVEDAPLVAHVLAALDARFSTDKAKIDKTVFNASRIFKCYGSIARKGDSTADRPHRVARLLPLPDTLPQCVARDVLVKIAESAPQTTEIKKPKGGKKVDLEKSAAIVERFLTEGGIQHGSRLDYVAGFKWQLAICPFNPTHRAPDIIVTVGETGAMGFKCSHNSCFDKKWEHFREYVETRIGHVFKFSDAPEPYNPAHIVTNPGYITEMVRRSEEVLHGTGLKYFERSSELVNTSYGRDAAPVKDIERAKDSVIIIPASHETIIRDLDSRAKYVVVVDTPMGQMEKKVHVPRNLPDQIHDRVRSDPREVPYPSLDMVTGSPVFASVR